MVKPKYTWLPSPNFTPKNPGRSISCIVLHATATSGKNSALEWLCNPQSKVSAHYLIDRLGMIYQLVIDQNIAWHAGQSEWKGKPNVNTFSIGIELVNSNDGIMLYPEEQIKACVGLCHSAIEEYKINLNDIVGHCDIAPIRKNDPLNFPWHEFRTMLINLGIEVAEEEPQEEST